MKGLEALWVLLFWAMLLFGAWIFEPRQAHHAPGRAAQLATWALLTVLTLAYGSVLLFVITNVLLFTLGTGAAAIGLLASLFLVVGTPIAWWLGVRAVVHRLDRGAHTPLTR